MTPVTEPGTRGRASAVDVGGEGDGAPIGSFHWRIVALCGLVFLFDGFDTQVIAFVAPTIADAWHVPVTSFGATFAAGLFGLMVGALIMGPLADRFDVEFSGWFFTI